MGQTDRHTYGTDTHVWDRHTPTGQTHTYGTDTHMGQTHTHGTDTQNMGQTHKKHAFLADTEKQFSC